MWRFTEPLLTSTACGALDAHERWGGELADSADRGLNLYLDPNLIRVLAVLAIYVGFIFQWFERFDLGIAEPGRASQLNKEILMPLELPVPSNLNEQPDFARASR
jgi:hypothetical protein